MIRDLFNAMYDLANELSSDLSDLTSNVPVFVEETCDKVAEYTWVPTKNGYYTRILCPDAKVEISEKTGNVKCTVTRKRKTLGGYETCTRTNVFSIPKNGDIKTFSAERKEDCIILKLNKKKQKPESLNEEDEKTFRTIEIN